MFIHTNICPFLFFPCVFSLTRSLCVFCSILDDPFLDLGGSNCLKNGIENPQLSQNVSEYHPPVGIWIACQALRIAIQPLQGLTICPSDLAGWTWKAVVAGVAMNRMWTSDLPKLECLKCKLRKTYFKACLTNTLN